MQINRTTPTFTGCNTVYVQAKNNKNVKYLYNKVLDIISHPEHRVPATFSSVNIRIDGPSDYSRNFNIVIEKLKEAGIKFSKEA